MNQSWPKVIRDPVHNIIQFENNHCDRLLLELINTREFQRLRRIKQLGMSELIFPAANHSRFAHSIGVMHITRRMLGQLRRENLKIDDHQFLIVSVAALLHDVGHGPFSHAFEKITDENHETRTYEMILDTSTEINKRLTKFQKSLPEKIAKFFDKSPEIDKKRTTTFSVLTQVVSSQLDADRFDYLLRDSYATGTNYGQFDLDWLLLHQKVEPQHPKGKRRLYLGKKAAAAAEAYVFARYHMYQAVYFHKATRAAEVMLKLAFMRYHKLLEGKKSLTSKAKIVPGVSSIILKAFSGKKISLNEYLYLDDFALIEFLKLCKNSKDRLLAELSSGIVNRNIYKGIDISGADEAAIGNFYSKAKDIVRKKGLDPDYSLVVDAAADTPYKYYDPDETVPATQIYLESPSGQIEEISKIREALKHLEKKYKMVRYYFPESIREKIDQVAKDTILKGG